jgi:hypothetical protein
MRFKAGRRAAVILILAALATFTGSARATAASDWTADNIVRGQTPYDCFKYNGTMAPDGCYILNKFDRQRLLSDRGYTNHHWADDREEAVSPGAQ